MDGHNGVVLGDVCACVCVGVHIYLPPVVLHVSNNGLAQRLPVHDNQHMSCKENHLRGGPGF